MRILVLAPHPFYQQRGTPIAEKELIAVLSDRGDEVEVLTYHEGDDPGVPRCTVHRIPRLPIRGVRPGFSAKKLLCDVLLLAGCLRLLRRRRFDLIHAAEESVFIALLAKALFGVPFVYDMDSSLSRQMIEKYPVLRLARRPMAWCERVAVRASAGVVAVCRALEDGARRHDPGKLIARVEDGSLLEPAAAPAEDLRRSIGRAGPIVMYVGNLEPYQGIELLLQAFARVVPARPRAQLVVIGGDIVDRRRYAGRAARLGLAAHAHFIGPRPLALLAGYLAQADILVSPRTRGDNTPMKVYSYLDSGRPLVATRLPTHTQVLDDAIARLVEPDPAALATGLIELLDDAGLRLRLAASARERVRREYTREALRRKIVRFYDALERSLATG